MKPVPAGPIAIITAGGGMKCAYSAGALVALAKELGVTKPEIFVAASGSVASMFYFLSGQYDDVKRAWTRYLPSSAVVKYFPFPSINLDYIIDTLFRVNVPLDEKKFLATETKWAVPVLDIETGETEFIHNDMWFDPYAVMRAAKALPILYSGHAKLGGKEFMDGDVSADISDLINEAVRMGAKRILCISNPKPRTNLERLLIILNAYQHGPVLRKVILRVLIPEREYKVPDDVKLVCLTPSYDLPAGLFTKNRRQIIETFNMGYDDLLSSREMVAELFGLPSATV